MCGDSGFGSSSCGTHNTTNITTIAVTNANSIRAVPMQIEGVAVRE